MLKKLAIAGALLATFAGAYAQSASFGVTGQITPGACTVALTGSGNVNTGSVPKATAIQYPTGSTGANTIYGFPVGSVPINITCTVATKVAVSFVDNKPAQRIAYDADDAARYGVGDGAAGMAAIGSYSVQFINTTIDNAAVGQFLTAANGTLTFSTTQPSATGYGPNAATPGRTIGFARAAGAAAPEAFSTLAGTLTFQTFVRKSYIDAATSTVTPTGSGTLTLVYL